MIPLLRRGNLVSERLDAEAEYLLDKPAKANLRHHQPMRRAQEDRPERRRQGLRGTHDHKIVGAAQTRPARGANPDDRC